MAAPLPLPYPSNFPRYAAGVSQAAIPTSGNVFTITGATGFVIRVYALLFMVVNNAAASSNYVVTKSSTAFTGGTANAVTPTPFDSAFPAASATVNRWSVAPTGGGALVGSGIENGRMTALAAATVQATDDLMLRLAWPTPVILRGTSQNLALGGMSNLAANVLLYANWIWEESTT